MLVCWQRPLASRHYVRILSPEDPPKPLCWPTVSVSPSVAGHGTNTLRIQTALIFNARLRGGGASGTRPWWLALAAGGGGGGGNPTPYAKGRTGDCPGPRKGATARRNATQGGRGFGEGEVWKGKIWHTKTVHCQIMPRCFQTRGHFARCNSRGHARVPQSGCIVGHHLKAFAPHLKAWAHYRKAGLTISRHGHTGPRPVAA